MTRGERAQGTRTALLAVAAVILLSAVVAVVLRGADGRAPTVEPGTSGGSNDPEGRPSGGEPSSTPTDFADEQAHAVLTDVDRAAGMRPVEVRAAAAHLVDGEWREHVHPAWQDRVAEWLPGAPIVVGDVTIGDDRRTIEAELVYLLGSVDDQVVLRVLAASNVLGDTGLDVAATVDGAAIEPQIDREGARVTIPVPASATGSMDRVLRVTVSYRVPLADQVIDDGGPAGGGLLARSDDVTTLGHWLPVPTFDTGPMVPRGDVAAFDAAVWSLRVRHPDVLVTGGTEAPCPDESGCTDVVGIALRDLSATLVDGDRDLGSAGTDDVEIRGYAPVGQTASDVIEEAAEAGRTLAGEYGPLPWPQVDVVGVPLGHAGMEFPGMVWVQSSRWRTDGGFSTYVIAHEIGHQWFHALVGNGSLSAPFIDESLAQYAAYVVFADLYGQERADELAADQFEGRFNRAGMPADAVCLGLDEFASASSYGAVVYGRGGQVWVDLERRYGRERVTTMLTTLIDQVGLSSQVMPEDLVAAASAAGDTDLEASLSELLLDDRC